MNIRLAILLCCFEMSLLAKSPSSTNFCSPVKYGIKLAGSFGEIRSKHFHAGIDIRSNKGGGGDSIFSAEEGFISRIKIDRSGYGKSLYISHPNGYTTVYAHMNNFNKDIEKYIYEMQQQMMSYEIDIIPEPNVFVLQKLKHIGFLGNTGYSHGPHLHFEIRETESDKVMNPLLFGIKPFDAVAPEIIQIRISGLTPDFDKIYDQKIKTRRDKKGHTLPIEVEVPAWRTGIAVKAYDKCTGCVNKNGIYRLEMVVDDTLTYAFDMKSFDFGENKLLLAHTDYEAKQKENTNEILCYKLPGNTLSFIKNGLNNGLINLYESRYRKVLIKVSDYHGNTSTQELRLKRKTVPSRVEDQFSGESVCHAKEYHLNCNGASISFKENTFAKKDKIQFHKNANGIAAFEIKNNTSPILDKFRLAVKIPDSLSAYKNQMILVKTSARGGNIDHGSTIEGDSIITFSDDPGLYRIFIDHEAPTIKPINFSNRPKSDFFRFKLNDNVYCRYKAIDFKYSVWVDEVWMPCEYKELSRTLTVPLKNLINGQHVIKIKTEDQKGNTGLWTGNFEIL